MTVFSSGGVGGPNSRRNTATFRFCSMVRLANGWNGDRNVWASVANQLGRITHRRGRRGSQRRINEVKTDREDRRERRRAGLKLELRSASLLFSPRSPASSAVKISLLGVPRVSQDFPTRLSRIEPTGRSGGRRNYPRRGGIVNGIENGSGRASRGRSSVALRICDVLGSGSGFLHEASTKTS